MLFKDEADGITFCGLLGLGTSPGVLAGRAALECSSVTGGESRVQGPTSQVAAGKHFPWTCEEQCLWDFNIFERISALATN